MLNLSIHVGFDCTTKTDPPSFVDYQNGYYSVDGEMGSTDSGTGYASDFDSRQNCAGSGLILFADYQQICHNCPPGWDCSQSPSFDPYTDNTQECQDGEYSDGSNASGGCSTCNTGDYCPSKTISSGVTCPTGTYQDSGSSTSCLICPKDHDCTN